MTWLDYYLLASMAAVPLTVVVIVWIYTKRRGNQ